MNSSGSGGQEGRDFGLKGTNHAGFTVSVEAAKAHGARTAAPVATIGPGPHEGKRAAYLRCPDGCTVELIQAP